MHIVGYTLITFQQMNICYRYSPLYWQTACLIVDSGGNDGDGGNDYGKISRASSSLHGKVLAPDINMSGLTFTPLPKEDKILFGLKPISGLRKDILTEIMEKRPFKSIEDFMDKTGATVNQTMILIKSGSFNKLYNSNQREIMIDFVDNIAVKERERLTMANFEEAYLNNIVDKEEFKDEFILYRFRKVLNSKKPQNSSFIQYFKDNLIHIPHDYDSNGLLKLDKSKFESYYSDKIAPAQEILSKKETIEKYNTYEKREFWIENCKGSVESWEMETISFYPNNHEFDYIPVQKYFPISNFNKMTEKGVIAGTVIDKDRNKNIIYLSTKDTVVTVKMWRNLFNKYNEIITNGKKGNKRVVYDDSWFDRGVKLVLVGNKSGEQFFLSNWGTNYSVPVYKIEKFDSENVIFAEERYNER